MGELLKVINDQGGVVFGEDTLNFDVVDGEITVADADKLSALVYALKESPLKFKIDAEFDITCEPSIGLKPLYGKQVLEYMTPFMWKATCSAV